MNATGEHPERQGDEDLQGPDIALSMEVSGEFYVVRPTTDRGRSWMRRNIPAAALTPEGELMIAPYYAPDLLAWMRADGLRARLVDGPSTP